MGKPLTVFVEVDRRDYIRCEHRSGSVDVTETRLSRIETL